MSNTVAQLEEKAKQIRVDILEMCYRAGSQRKAHPAPALSSADLVACLFYHEMKLFPGEWDHPDRDRFVLSKGHACPVLYAALAGIGAIEQSELQKLRQFGSKLKGHPDMKKIPGVDMTAGSLGHGLAGGLGMALGARISGKDFRTYVILGDGETQEGIVWEAALAASAQKVDNLVAFVDRNHLQSCGKMVDICDMEPYADKWTAFGWNVISIDGHNIEEILKALETAKATKGKPTLILANTIKGKGISYMENDNSWHQKAITDEEYAIGRKELGVG